MSVMPPELTLQMRDGVACVTLNRPGKANALNLEMLQALERILADCAADEGARALILTGAGSRAFSAGADLTPIRENPQAHAAQRRARFAAVLLALLDFAKPTVAAVNGAACGAGLMLAVLCDAVIAAETARFSLPEIKAGLATLPGATILSRRHGVALAADLVLSGRYMPAEEALRRGLAGEVVAGETLERRAHEIALQLARNDVSAYRANKSWLNRELRAELAGALEASAQLHQR